MKKIYISILLLLFAFCFTQAQNLFEGNISTNYNSEIVNVNLASLQKENESEEKEVKKVPESVGFQYKWAWELPNYREDPKCIHFIEPSWVVDNVNYFTIARDTNQQDIQSFFTVIALRTFAFQWEKGSISFGPYWAYALESFEGRNDSALAEIQGVETNLTIDGLESVGQTHSVGISGLLTLENIGLQANINLGYYYTMSQTDIEEYTGYAVSGLDWFDMAYRDYKYDQRSEGFFCYSEFYLGFDRQYLNFFRFRCQILCQMTSRRKGSRASLELGHSGVTSPGRVKLPYTLIEPNTFTPISFPDLQEDRTTNTTIFTSLNSTLLTIPFGIESKPFFPEQGISFDFISSLTYYKEYHGYSVGIGTGITILDLVEVDYQYVWEQDNDSYDYWTLLVALLI